MKKPALIFSVILLSMGLCFSACDSGNRSENTETTTEEPEVQIGTEEIENENRSLIEVMQSRGNLSTFLSLIESARMVETLNADGTYTIFAPSDEALAKLPQGQLDQLKNLDFQELRTVIGHHMLSRRLVQSEVEKGVTVDNLGGHNLPLRTENGTVMIGEARVTEQGIPARNGVIHVIDRMLFPEGFRLGQ
jgi:uncharacterized surface protein with fasciclin (FAS1) repeats